MRVSLILIAFISILFSYWWMALIAGALLSARYAAWEVLVLGLLADLLWYPSVYGMWPIATIVSIALVWGMGPVRRRILPR